jgi:hypothetical protein
LCLLNSTSATSALSAKQGSILKGLVDDKANSTGDNSIAFNVAVATSDNNAVNKGVYACDKVMLRNVYGTVLAVNRLFSNNTVSLYPELNELSIYAFRSYAGGHYYGH